MRTINWNAEKLKALKKAYEAAIAKPGHRINDAITVELPGEREPAEFVLNYAKYLIEYLDGEFARNPPRDFGPNNEGKEGE